MKSEKGGVGLVVSIVIAILLVGIVAWITFRPIGTSVTNNFEMLKKMVGIETSKAEASTTNTDECTIKRYYWGKKSATIGEKVGIIIEGSGNCDGKIVNITIYQYGLISDRQSSEFNVKFKENNINADAQVNDVGEYYFVLKFNNKKYAKSERLTSASK